jgi:predicted alpha/beta-hydrolase family hydrolase
VKEYSITSIKISGYGARFVPNRFYKQPGIADTLALVFPGVQYSCDMPLLYYPSLLLREKGADVLHVQTEYISSEYRSLPVRERAEWLFTDARSAARAALTQRDYTRMVLVGKSIGTLALTHLVTNTPWTQAITIWLTPLLPQPMLAEAVMQLKSPALFIVGTDDDTYDADILARIQQVTKAEALVIEGADHYLQIPGDTLASLNAMQKIVQTTADFLTRHMAVE